MIGAAQREQEVHVLHQQRQGAFVCLLIARFWSAVLSAVCPQRSQIQVNLKKGTITVPPGEPEAVQHIR